MKIQKHNPAFTLIEILIVIIIIGILAAALIPRLQSAKGRANDTARKADMQQIATSLVAYQNDLGQFPDCDGCSLDDEDLTVALIRDAGLGSIPHDPVTNKSFVGLDVDEDCNNRSAEGQYTYTTLIKNGVPAGGFAIMAGTETLGGSNYVVEVNRQGESAGFGCIYKDLEENEIELCPIVRYRDDFAPCENIKNYDGLRYMYLY